MTDYENINCPYCDEEIKAIAIKCKHCHSMLENKENHCNGTEHFEGEKLADYGKIAKKDNEQESYPNCGGRIRKDNKANTKEFTVSGYESGDGIVAKKNAPIIGVISVVLSGISLIMLLILVPVGIAQTGSSGFATFLATLSLSFVFIIAGIVTGYIGLMYHPKLLSILSLMFGAIYIIILAVILVTA